MLIDINRDPSTTQLRQFALSTLVMLPLVVWLWSARTVPMVCASAAAFGILLCGWLRPGLLKPLFIGLSILTWPIGFIVSEVVLLVLFYAVFAPAGLISRLLRRDPLDLKPDSAVQGAWKAKKPETDTSRYYRMS